MTPRELRQMADARRIAQIRKLAKRRMSTQKLIDRFGAYLVDKALNLKAQMIY